MSLRKYPPLVITTAVSTGDVPYVGMTDSDERINKYLKSIDVWLKKIPDIQIVLCDGTGFDWNILIDQRYNKQQFECLTCFNDVSKVEKFGKGYGEIEILNHVVDNSKMVQKARHFMKITGKYWIDNIAEFSNKELFSNFKCKSIFKISSWSLLYINTVFFSCSVVTYRQYFYESYKLVNDHTGNDLEHVMAQLITEYNIRDYQFIHAPVIRGWSGTGNHAIDLTSKSIKDKLRTIKYWVLSFLL